MATKFGVGDDIGDSYPCAKFHYNPITDFFAPGPALVRRRVQSDSPSFLYSQDPWTDFHDQYVKWRRFVQGCAFWGLENKILHFDPIPPKKNRKFWPIFEGTFASKRPYNIYVNALTMAMLTCKLPLIVMVAPWKLYSK